MSDWHIKSTDQWICWICGLTSTIEWWAHPNNPKQYAICNRCKPAFSKVVAFRKEKP